MAETQPKLEITPRVVVLGDKVIQLHHLVSAGRDAVFPLRPVGLALLAIGIALIGSEFGLRGAQAFALSRGGSLALWVGFAATGIGIFLALYARRLLVLRTSDGVRLTVPTDSEESAAAFLARIREAMEAGRDGSAASVPQQLPAQPAAGFGETPALAPRSSTPLGLPHAGSQPIVRAGSDQYTGPSQTMPLGRRLEGYANGHAGPQGRAGFPSAGLGNDGAGAGDGGLSAQRRSAGPQASPFQLPGGVAHAATAPDAGHAPALREPLSLPSTSPPLQARDEGPRDLSLLMEHVRRADVQHKEALLDLLRVVEEHYRGRASREDAMAHWHSFADYVGQYLGDVDGLLAHTERFGRHMLVR